MNEVANLDQETRLPAINLGPQLPTPDFIEHWIPAYGTDQIEKARKALPDFEKSLATMPKDRIKVLFLNWFLPFKMSGNLTELEMGNLVKIYISVFEDMPADLVEIAMKHVAHNFKWGTPQPADYKDAVAGEAARRNRIVNCLKAYISYHDMKESRRANLKPAIVGEERPREGLTGDHK